MIKKKSKDVLNKYVTLVDEIVATLRPLNDGLQVEPVSYPKAGMSPSQFACTVYLQGPRR